MLVNTNRRIELVNFSIPFLWILTCTGTSLAVLDGHLGIVPDRLKILLGMFLGFAAMVATGWERKSWSTSLSKWALASIALFTALGCLFAHEPSVRLLSPGLFLLSATLVQVESFTSAEWSILAGATLYGLGAIYMEVFPVLWTTVTQSTVIITQAITWMAGSEFGLGASALPLGTATFILIILFIELSRPPFLRKWRSAFLMFVLLFICLLGQVFFMGTLAASTELTVPTAWGLNALISTMNTLIMLLAAGFCLLKIDAPQSSSRVPIIVISGLAVVLTVLLVSTYGNPRGSPRSGDILFISPPPELDPLEEYRSIPSEQVPLHNVGLFGEFPKQLRSIGFSVVTETGMPTSRQLDGISLVCLVVPSSTWAGGIENLHTLQRFVLEGGSLLVIAEHTNLQMNATIINTLLSPFGIKVNFDTTNAGFAEDLRGVRLWPSDYRTIFNGLSVFPYNRGASLTLNYPAKPVMVGRWWQSDYGNWLAIDQAFLGDFLLSPYDKFGDLILAAEWRGTAGGRILVFGDTTPFLNTALGYTLPSLKQMIQILTTPPAVSAWGFGVVAGFCLIGFLIAVWRWNSALAQPITLITVGVLVLLLGFLDHKKAFPISITSPTLLVLTDFQNKLDLSIYGDWAPTALMVEARRQNLIPMVVNLDQVKAMRPPKVFILPAPRRLPSTSERLLMESWIKEGATMVLTVAGDVAPAVKVAKQFGLEVGGNPLGPVAVSLSEGEVLQFHSAWPLKLESMWTPVVEYQEIPVVARRTLGLGQIVVIGDEGLAANLALATERTVLPSNLRWWGRLFKGNDVSGEFVDQ